MPLIKWESTILIFCCLNKDYKKAELILLNAVVLCRNNNLELQLLQIYKNLSNVYNYQNNMQKAFDYSQKYIKKRDEVDKGLHKMFLDEKQQSLNRMQDEINTLVESEERQHLELELKYKKRELISKKLHSVASREFLENIYYSLNSISMSDKKVENVKKMCSEQIKKTSTWVELLNTYRESDPVFIDNLRSLSKVISITETRICSLIHLGLDNYEISLLCLHGNGVWQYTTDFLVTRNNNK